MVEMSFVRSLELVKAAWHHQAAAGKTEMGITAAVLGCWTARVCDVIAAPVLLDDGCAEWAESVTGGQNHRLPSRPRRLLLLLLLLSKVAVPDTETRQLYVVLIKEASGVSRALQPSSKHLKVSGVLSNAGGRHSEQTLRW